MARYYFQATKDEDGSNSVHASFVHVSFEADDIWTVLERFQAFLRTSDFPYVDEVSAVAYAEDGDEEDLHYYSDGTALTGSEIDALNANETPDTQENN